MYFRHLYYDENNNVISLELECDICSNYIEIELPNDNITEAKDDYCVITNGSKILCKCGNYCQSDKITCKDTINTCKKDGYFKVINVSEQRRQAQANAQAQELLNKPKCPTCGSTNIKKIGSIERGASIAAFGIFSKKINKTFKCNNCGYTW